MSKINIHREWYKNKRLGDFGISNPITNKLTRSPKRQSQEKYKMVSIREQAEAYIPPETKVVSELEKVSTEIEVFEKEATDKKGQPFKYNYIIVNDVEYRVPNTVLKQLKEQLEEKPDCVSFKVKSSGTGLNTTYTVIMLD